MYIEHPGFVSSCTGGKIKVSLLESSGCAICHKGLCIAGDPDRQVEIPVNSYPFKAGDEVTVRINPSSGYAAVAWLYVVPFILMIAVLMGMLLGHFNEGWSGLCAVLVLVPYYSLLYLGRRIFRTQCKIDVIKR